MRVITSGGTARIVMEERVSRTEQLGEVMAGVLDCADAGVEELVIAVPEFGQGWLEDLEKALIDTPDPLRIWVAVGDTDSPNL